MLQVGYLLLQFFSAVGVAHAYTVAAEVLEQGAVVDVAAGQDSLLAALERLVFYELGAMAVVDERVACDARLLLIGFAEAAVYHKPLALRADRRLPLDGTHGDMPVDDTPCLGVKSELAQYLFAYIAAVG